LRNKTRSILAMLGIIIGVGSVITMLGLGEGTKAQIESRIRSMGTNLISVRAGEQRQGGIALGKDNTQVLELEDVAAIEKNCPAVLRVAPRQERSFQVKYRNKNIRTEVLGTTTAYFPIRNYQLDTGRLFFDTEVARKSRVCVMGPVAVENLFGRSNPLGRTVQVRGQPFRVIGTLKPRGGGDTDWDERVWIPITTGMRRLFGVRYVGRIEAEAVDQASMDAAQSQIDALLRKRHRIGDDVKEAFEVRNQLDLLQTANETSGFLTMLLAGIAGVSLVVGGIGIMNIMLVSVAERTREIGIRRALGARQKDVLHQFLVEALVMCSLGAILGVAAGLVGCWVGTAKAGWPIVIAPYSIVISSACAVLTGLFFGIYPARRASVLSPLEALRHE
ncbi:MAG: FtsX-like permease family protein, partial [Armatimonadetes bacterium]|nr:FtsX-like permease family protein [Armatimonadota bacterium]